MSFIVTIPPSKDKSLIQQLHELGRLSQCDEEHPDYPGRIVVEDWAELEYQPIAGAGQVKMTVITNPSNTPETLIKERMEEGILQLDK
jgi:hypothetical protein